MRIASSVLAPIGYLLLLSGSVAAGAALNLAGQILLAPFAFKNKAWDLLALVVFFSTANLMAIAPAVQSIQTQINQPVAVESDR